MKRLFLLLIIANNKRGKAIPSPNKINPIKLIRKLVVLELNANKIINDDGLHGRTIKPKKAPNKKELNTGFFDSGALNFPKYLLKSIPSIIKMLIIPNISNAIGEIIPITFVKLCSKIFVKIKPNKAIEEITPNATVIPSFKIEFLLLDSD